MGVWMHVMPVRDLCDLRETCAGNVRCVCVCVCDVCSVRVMCVCDVKLCVVYVCEV